MEENRGNYSLPYKIKADWKGFLIFLFLLEIPFLLIAFTLSGQRIPLWICGLIIGFLPVSWWFLLSTFEIKITDDRLIHRSLFGKNAEILFSDIKSVKFTSGINKPSGRGYGFFRLSIENKTKISPLNINMKMLSARDLAVLVDVILTKNPSVKTDKPVERIRKRSLRKVITHAIILNTGQKILIIIFLTISIILFRLIF